MNKKETYQYFILLFLTNFKDQIRDEINTDPQERLKKAVSVSEGKGGKNTAKTDSKIDEIKENVTPIQKLDAFNDQSSNQIIQIQDSLSPSHLKGQDSPSSRSNFVRKENRALSFLKGIGIIGRSKVVPVKGKSKKDIQKLFRKCFIQVLTIVRLNKMCEDIRNYGTSPGLYDVAVRSRSAVKKIIFPFVDSENNNSKDKQIKLSFPLIAPESKLFRIWNPLLMGLIFYSATILPYRIAFQDDIPLEWEIFDLVIDSLFGFDLLLNMVSSYYDDYNQLVTSRRKVLFNYFKSWFIIDLLSCIPVEMIMGTSQGSDNNSSSSSTSNGDYSSKIKLLRLAKLPRMYRLLKIMKVAKMVKYFGTENKFLESIKVNTGVVRLMNLFFMVIFLVHFFGCIWYYQAKLQNFDEDTWVYRGELLNQSNYSLYQYSIYFVFATITTLGYGDIVPYSKSEIIIALVLMIIGVGFYSSTIGILSSVIQYMDSKQIYLQRKMEQIKEYCNEMKIPNTIKTELKEALTFALEKNCFIWANQSKVFDSLPMNLKYDICMNVQRGIMKNFSFLTLADDQSFVVRIVPMLRPIKLLQGDVIWNQSDIPESIFLLGKGRVNYLKSVVQDVNTKEKKAIMFKTMINGSYFGEIDIILDRKRIYKCQAETDCELFYITKQEYDIVLKKEFPHVHTKLKQIAYQREQKNEEALQALKKLIRHAKEVADMTDYKNQDSIKPDEIIAKQNNNFTSTSQTQNQEIKRDINLSQQWQQQQYKSKQDNNHNLVLQEPKLKPIKAFQRAVHTIQMQRLYNHDLQEVYGSPTTMGKQEREGEAETFSNRIMQIKKQRMTHSQNQSNQDDSMKEDFQNQIESQEGSPANIINPNKFQRNTNNIKRLGSLAAEADSQIIEFQKEEEDEDSDNEVDKSSDSSSKSISSKSQNEKKSNEIEDFNNQDKVNKKETSRRSAPKQTFTSIQSSSSSHTSSSQAQQEKKSKRLILKQKLKKSCSIIKILEQKFDNVDSVLHDHLNSLQLFRRQGY